MHAGGREFESPQLHHFIAINSIMRIVDTLIVFRILKLLTTPFEKQKAYHFGYIDKNGKRITHKMKDGVKAVSYTHLRAHET